VIGMADIYTDYVNRTVLTLPDTFIDVKTGETLLVSPKMLEQVEYHTNNNTLIHLLLSALNDYLHPKRIKGGGSDEVLQQLSEIKSILQKGYIPRNHFQVPYPSNQRQLAPVDLELKDIDDVLDAFGG
jgi:hypothetical protein